MNALRKVENSNLLIFYVLFSKIYLHKRLNRATTLTKCSNYIDLSDEVLAYC